MHLGMLMVARSVQQGRDSRCDCRPSQDEGEGAARIESSQSGSRAPDPTPLPSSPRPGGSEPCRRARFIANGTAAGRSPIRSRADEGGSGSVTPASTPAMPTWPATSARPMPSGSASARSRASPRTTPSALVAARGRGYDLVRDLWLRSGLAPRRDRAARRCRCLPLARPRPPRGAMGGARARRRQGTQDRLPLFDTPELADIRREPDFALPPMPLGEHVVNDYRFLSLSLKAHPVSFLRDRLAATKRSSPRAEDRSARPHERPPRHRRRPGPRPPAAGHGERRHLHDHRGRDRHRQHRRLAEDLRAIPADRARRAPRRGHRQGAERERRHPCRRRPARRPDADASALSEDAGELEALPAPTRCAAPASTRANGSGRTHASSAWRRRTRRSSKRSPKPRAATSVRSRHDIRATFASSRRNNLTCSAVSPKTRQPSCRRDAISIDGSGESHGLRKTAQRDQAGAVRSGRLYRLPFCLDDLSVGVVAPSVPDLLAAYPDSSAASTATSSSGATGRACRSPTASADKDFDTLLDHPDIDDMFVIPYRPGPPSAAPGLNEDPGRVRYEPLFTKMYGDCEKGEVTADARRRLAQGHGPLHHRQRRRRRARRRWSRSRQAAAGDDEIPRPLGRHL